MFDVAIIGGGLAGLTNSILLSRAGLEVVLIEKNQYPFHRVCGEYISNEVVPFLENHDLYPADFEPPRIDQLLLSSTSGRSFRTGLDLGGFGISRYTYDHWLVRKAKDSGVQILSRTQVKNVQYQDDQFQIETNAQALTARLVIAAHGKRSKLDQTLDRDFLQKHSPYVGVKYHVKTDLPEDQIALHNFQGGYCGVSRIEAGQYNICYLAHRDGIKLYGNIQDYEENVLYTNPHLKHLFQHSDFLFDKPEVINEITFDKAEPVHQHMLMCGDAAGMITPLCGNGMAMAFHAAHLLSGLIIRHWQKGDFNQQQLEHEYSELWHAQFARRLWAGRKIQNSLFGNGWASQLAVFTGKYLKPVSNALIRQTHGQPFS